MAVRWAMLLVAAWLSSAAIGATAAELQPGALRLVLAAVVGLLAPLLWPGLAASPGRTAGRIVLWSAGAAGVAMLLPALRGSPVQAWAGSLQTCAMLLPILLLTHAGAAGLERILRARALDAGAARAMAGFGAALALALLGALPLWFGPAAELLSDRHDGLVDAAVGISPLTHLAVASGNDLLRNEWLYQHANLAALPVSYPGLAALAGCYGALCLALGLLTIARLRARSQRIPSTHEDTPS